MAANRCVLSLHPWLDSHPLWQKHTISIAECFPHFYSLPLRERVTKVLRVAGRFHSCVLYYDMRFALIAGELIKRVTPARINLVDVYPTVMPRLGIASIGKHWAYHRLFQLMDLTFVHARFEIDMYSTSYRVPVNKFRFLPYYPYYDGFPPVSSDWDRRWREGYILCPGRHRDLQTFIRAVADINREAIVVAAHQDVASLQLRSLPSRLRIYTDLSSNAYYDLFAGAAVVVLPFYDKRFLRSLGQIAYFEAARHLTPVVSSRTPHLEDYADDGREMLCYTPGEPEDLAHKLRRLLSDRSLAQMLAQGARTRILNSFSRDNYVESLLAQLA